MNFASGRWTRTISATGGSNAVQISETAGLDAREQAGDGQALGERDPQGQKAPEKGAERERQMNLFRRNYNSRERLSERIGDLDDKFEKFEAKFQALSNLLEVAYRDGFFASTEAFHIVPKEKDKK
jgi:hypothetical protein